MTFDFSKIPPGVPLETIEDTLFIKELNDFDGNRIEKSPLMVKFSSNIKTLIIKSQPEYLRRVFDPPFDTLQYNFNGEMVKVPDLSIHYKVRLRSNKDQRPFLNNAKMLTGILDAEIPPGPDMTTEDGNVPPNDSHYNLQWYLHENETYGTQAEKAWEIQHNNTTITIHINEYANGSISSVNHEDLNGNIVYSQFTNPDNNHFIGVCGVTSAVTDNSLGVAGTAYNSKIRLTAASAIEDRASHLKNAADNWARVANFSWNTSVDNAQFRDAVEYAFNKGVFIVCSGGNTGTRQTERYPSNYDNYVMAVAPLDIYGNQPSWATWGPHIDITAPGVQIYTTTSQPIWLWQSEWNVIRCTTGSGNCRYYVCTQFKSFTNSSSSDFRIYRNRYGTNR